MKTLYDLGMAVTGIREAIDKLEVRGCQNASLIKYAYEKCNDIIKMINDVTEQQSQNGQEAEVNGEQDSGITD